MPMLDTSRSHPTVAARRDAYTTLAVIDECKRCTMCFNGNGPVAPSGPMPNDIMVIGEAPTRSDDRLGRVSHKGDASLLLRQLLARVDLDLDRLFFVNAVQCWPERTVLEQHLRACAPNVKDLIRICDPILVLSLGATALKVTSDRPGRTITRDHGKPFTSRAGPFIGRTVFPTWSPAAIKHTPSAVTALSADIAAFADTYRELKRLQAEAEAPF